MIKNIKDVLMICMAVAILFAIGYLGYIEWNAKYSAKAQYDKSIKDLDKSIKELRKYGIDIN